MCGTDATHLRGHKVQVQTRVRSHSVDSACLWLRVDLHTDEPAGYRLLAFDNMYLRGIRGTTPWHEARIVLDVPEEATHIAWGMILDGNGRFEAEEFAPEVAPPEAASTCMLLKEQDPGYRRIYEIKQELDELRQLVSTRSDSSRVSRPAFHWAARTRPATELGGDTFLIRLLENNQLLVFLCDVAGHGLSASLVAASCRGVVWQSARSVPFEGAALLSSLNDLVREHTVRPRPLASTCLMLIDTDSGLWRGWLNGTPNPVAVDRTGTSLPLFTGSGLPIGALSRPTLHEETGQLAPGERILLHTDGLIEVVSPSGTQWAETGLENALLHGVRTSLQRQLDRVFRSVDLHQGSTPQQDDQTLIMIERRRESNRPRPIRHIKSL
jgi:predicted metal-binding protein